MAWKAWFIAVVLTILSGLGAWYGLVKENKMIMVQSAFVMIVAVYFSFYALLTFLGWGN